MYCLYVNIDNLKLLKKINQSKISKIECELNNIALRMGGMVQDKVPFLYYFSSLNYQSVLFYLHCVKKMYYCLKNTKELIGFSLIGSSSDEFYDDDNFHKQLNLYTVETDHFWLMNDLITDVAPHLQVVKRSVISLVPAAKMDEPFLINTADEFFKDSSFSDRFSLALDSASRDFYSSVCINQEMNSHLYNNVKQSAVSQKFEDIITLDFSHQYWGDENVYHTLLSGRESFQPEEHLSYDELEDWKGYKEFWENFQQENIFRYHSDDCIKDLSQAVKLWLKACCRAGKVLIVVYGISNEHQSTIVKDLTDVVKNNSSVFLIVSSYKALSAPRWKVLSYNGPTETFLQKQYEKLFHDWKNSGYFSSLVENLRDPFFIYMALWISSFTGEDKTEGSAKDILLSFLKLQDEDMVCLLYYLCLSEGAVDFDFIINLLNCSPQMELRFKGSYYFFKKMGFIYGENFFTVHSSLCREVIEENYGDCSRWLEFLSDILVQAADNQELKKYRFISEILLLKGDFNLSLAYLKDYLIFLMDQGISCEAVFENYRKISDKLGITSEEAGSLKSLKHYSELRMNKKLTFMASPDCNAPYNNMFLYQRTLCSWGQGMKGAQNNLKELLYSFQNEENMIMENRVKIAYSLALLASGDSRQAAEYLEIVWKNALAENQVYTYIRSVVFFAAAEYVNGNYSGVLRIAEKCLSKSEFLYAHRWYCMLLFFKVRACFDLGQYKECIKIIPEGLKRAEKHQYRDISQVLNNWYARAHIYDGDIEGGLRILGKEKDSVEKSLFISEAYYFSKQYDRALTMLENSQGGDDKRFLVDENIPWHSGFALADEYYCFFTREVSALDLCIKAFRYYLMGLCGKKEEAAAGLQGMVEGGETSSSVHNHFFIYYLYETVKDQGNLQMNSNLVIKFTRFLQLRAGNIDNHKFKFFYLNSRWNRRIVKLAKHQKLL